jgi:hypothetical protein
VSFLGSFGIRMRLAHHTQARAGNFMPPFVKCPQATPWPATSGQRATNPAKQPGTLHFTVSAEVYLDSGQLKGWQNWTALSQQYLARAPAQISVRTVVEGYYALVNRLYTWLQTCLTTYHQDALSTLEARKNEIVEEIRRRGMSI